MKTYLIATYRIEQTPIEVLAGIINKRFLTNCSCIYQLRYEAILRDFSDLCKYIQYGLTVLMYTGRIYSIYCGGSAVTYRIRTGFWGLNYHPQKIITFLIVNKLF